MNQGSDEFIEQLIGWYYTKKQHCVQAQSIILEWVISFISSCMKIRMKCIGSKMSPQQVQERKKYKPSNIW